MRRLVETKCHLCPPLQIWEARIRLAWRGSARHWRQLLANFRRKMAQWCRRTKNHTKQSLVVDASASPWRADSLTPKYNNSACSHSHRGENELQKRWFFGKNALQLSVVQPIGRIENASDDHAASILALIELCMASQRGLYSKFFSKKCMKCSSFENDGELMLIVVQAHSE